MILRLERLRTWTTAQLLALVLGLWWIGNGIAVFVADHGAATSLGKSGQVDTPGLSIAVNGWHGILHLLTGLAGVAVSQSPRASRAFGLTIGILYLAAATWGLASASLVFGVIRVDDLGSADHAFEGVLLLTGWLVSRPGGLIIGVRAGRQ